MQIYLSGPAVGVEYLKAATWRNQLARILADQGLRVVNPLSPLYWRAISKDKILPSYEMIGLRPRDIFQAAKTGIANSDIMVSNLKEWNDESFGSAFEIGMASALGIPILCIAGEKKASPFVSEACILVDDIEDALDFILNFPPLT